MTASWVCLNILLVIHGYSFGMDLVCLLLNQLDVILGMNWLEFNHVHINYFDKTVMFIEIGENGELMFISAKQVYDFLKDEAQVFAVFYSLRIDIKTAIVELLVVFDFPKVFPNDINKLPPKREV